MGGCSSKPKTSDFEGVVGLQEDHLEEEASSKNFEAENAGWKVIERQQVVCELPVQIQVVEQTKRHDETQDVPASPEKRVIKGFKEETPVFQNNCQHVLEETINESGIEKEPPSHQQLPKLQMTPENSVRESSVCDDDSVLIIDFTKEVQEDMPLSIAHNAEAVDAEHKLLNVSNGTLKINFSNGNSKNGEKGIERGSFSDSSSPSLQDAQSVELKPNFLRDGHIELSKDHLCKGVGVLELQREPLDLGDCHSGLQEEASKSEMESEHHNQLNENGEQKGDEHVTSQEQDKHFELGIKECELSCKESEAGACEGVRAASDVVFDLENENEVLKDFSKPLGEDMITGESCNEAGEGFIINASNDTKSSVAEASDLESSKEIAKTVGRLAITADAITVTSQHLMFETTEAPEADVKAAGGKSAERFVKILAEPERPPIEDKMAVKDVTLLAERHLVNDDCVKESSVESLDTVDGEDELVCRKNCCNDKHLPQPPAGEVPSHLKLETSSEGAQENKPCAVVFDLIEQQKSDLEGQQKSDGTSFPNGTTTFQETATPKKPEVQPVCAKEFTELAFIPAQDIPGPDIDEVLEKLASEFERQERVACATP